MTVRKHSHLGCLAALVLATACANECGPVTRTVDGSGRFGDTLAAVSGDTKDPGTVSLSVWEYRYDHSVTRHGSYLLNTAGIADTVSLYRLTLKSDPTRTPLMSSPTNAIFTPDSVTFETLWVHLATEDVLFEITSTSGGIAKALLNLESRIGPVIKCVRT